MAAHPGSDEDEAFLGPDLDPQVSDELTELAAELRRALDLLVGSRPDPGVLAPATAAARALTAALEPLPSTRRGGVPRPYDPNRFNPVSGACNPASPPLVMWFEGEGLDDGPAGRRSEGRVTFGLTHQGPPGHAHGGAVTAVYDDFLGRSQRQAGFTGTFTVTFRQPTPLDRELALLAWVDRVDGRKRWVRGTCHLDGVLLHEAEGLFIAPRAGGTMENLAGMLPQP
ncbi:MAG TPA: hypothetical protein VMZ11_04605 [Mycobacteriales bacterium]|nr:hypothetical protein [Mycobacteriales bacterium]